MVAGTSFAAFIPTPVIKYKKKAASKSYSVEYDLPAMYHTLKHILLGAVGWDVGAGPIKGLVIEMPFASKLTPKEASFSLGYNFGTWEAITMSLGIPYIRALPRVWMKSMHAGQPVSMDTKTKSIRTVQQLLPDVDLRRTQRSKKYDDNKADAILLAAYAKRLAW